MAARMLANHQHLPQVRLRLCMALEAVLIPTLFLANLAEPPEALQAFGFHLVRDIFRCTDCDS
jgi:hypothetical protein